MRISLQNLNSNPTNLENYYKANQQEAFPSFESFFRFPSAVHLPQLSQTQFPVLFQFPLSQNFIEILDRKTEGRAWDSLGFSLQNSMGLMKGEGGVAGECGGFDVNAVKFHTTSFPFEEIHDNNNSVHHRNEHINGKYNRYDSSKSCKNLPPPIVSSVGTVIELLECPVCTNSMYPPIFQCHNGHTICSTCRPRVHDRCPTCRQELGDIRCLALEKVAESLELPCKYNSLGCTESFPYYNKLKHEQMCDFRPYNCPYAGSECSFAGDISCIVSHLRDYHKVDMHNGFTFNHRYVKANPNEVVNATWMLTVFNCFDQYFCLHFEAFELGTSPVYMAFIRFMGDEAESKNFRYSLEVGGSGRKATWEGIPRSIRDSHQQVRDSNDGLIIHRKMALTFSGGDHKQLKLRVIGRIWREEDHS